MIKTNYLHFILLFTVISFSQNKETYNSDDLTRLTFGFQQNFYDAPEYSRNSTQGGIGAFDVANTTGFFINYKVLKFKNHSLKVGIALNTVRHELWYKGTVTDVQTGEIRPVSNRPNPFVENMKALEYSIDYSYLIKLDKKWFLDLSIGLSQERNQAYGIYTSDASFTDEFLNPYQHTASSVYFYKRRFGRINYAAALGYKTEYGMVNLGVRYSKAHKQVASGQYQIFNPGVSEMDQSYGFFQLSGNYFGATLSFTPSKNIFKKKK